jgi:hypothetical protein
MRIGVDRDAVGRPAHDGRAQSQRDADAPSDVLFAFAHFERLENFAVYAVVYAVYFFPWRVLRHPGANVT